MSTSSNRLVGLALRKLVWSVFNKPHTPEIPGGIASLEKVTLGGFPQWCLIRGYNRDAPVLLFIHGGPGSPDMSLHRHYNSELEKHFVVVYWDQWGSGKSLPGASKSGREGRIREYLRDAHELVTSLKERFNKERIFVLGHSWGSVLGMRLISEYPGDFLGYVGMGQVVHLPESEKHGYAFALQSAEKAGDLKGIKALKAIGEPVDAEYRGGLKGLSAQRKWLMKYGGCAHNHKSYDFVIGPLFTATEYSFADAFRFLLGSAFTIKKPVWKEITSTVDFRRDIPEVGVPCYFFTGRYDYQVSFALTEELFKGLKAPHKEMVWFEDSGHMPCFEEPDRFNGLMVEKLLG